MNPFGELEVHVQRLHPEAILPRYAHGPEEDAGLDLCAVKAAVVPAGERMYIGCGFALAIPTGYHGEVRPRSGLALKHGITVLNTPGTIDPGYRGEIGVVLINHSREPFYVRVGDRVAQLVVMQHEIVALREVVDEPLPATNRGGRGFGSTGIATVAPSAVEIAAALGSAIGLEPTKSRAAEIADAAIEKALAETSPMSQIADIVQDRAIQELKERIPAMHKALEESTPTAPSDMGELRRAIADREAQLAERRETGFGLKETEPVTA